MAFRVETNAEPIPGYKLLERLGGGGFGEVWKAVAPGGMLKAIKFVYGDIDDCGDEGMRAEQELKALSRVKTIRHPFILSLERYEIVAGQLLIVTELADRNLWDRFKECRVQGLVGIPREELLSYMEEVAEGLDLMNSEYQLQHLDIKPQNLFLVYNHIKIADFGLVKDLEGMVAKVTGGVTPIYAAPETFDGWVSRFCDQYSLAIVYQELLTGRRPFPGTSIRQLIVQHMQGTPDLSSLPESDRGPIGRALSKKPDERFPSCRNLVDGLRNGAAQPATASAPTAISPPPPPTGHTVESPHPSLFDTAQRFADETAPTGSSDDDESVQTQQLARKRGPTAPAAVEGTIQGSLPPLQHSDGVLVPALVVGLGGLGLQTLLATREKLTAQFGNLGVLSHLRFLCVDTDPQVLRQAGRGSAGLALANSELVLARLNRPSYYFKNRDAHNSLDTWFDLHMLYRIPRTLETAGIRALGRLAFCDNHASIARTVRQELEECTKPDNLNRAISATGLGLRCNRPRVYIVCSLMGGTGSGMFLDTAYLVRQQLRALGIDNPEVIGIFFVPGPDRSSQQALALGNTHAALRELNHFSTPGRCFSFRYSERGKSVVDSAAPFVRAFLLQLHDAGKDEGNGEVVEAAGDFLRRDLTQPFGRVADLSRAELPAALHPEPGAVCHAFGTSRFDFPRRALLRQSASLVSGQLLDRWVAKDSTDLKPTLQEWAQQHWSLNEFGADGMIQLLLASCEKLLGQTPDTMFAAIAQGVVTELEAIRSARKLKTAPAEMPPFHQDAAQEMLAELDALLGQLTDEPAALETAPVPAALARAAEDLVAQVGQKLAETTIALIEQPDYRLAGAEEAIRQFLALIQKTLEHQEPLCKDLAARAFQSREQIENLLKAVSRQPEAGPKAQAAAAENVKQLIDFILAHPRWRYQSQLLQQLSSSYVSLRGNLSDLLRDVHQCRTRLLELRSRFAVDQTPEPVPTTDGKAVIRMALQSLRRAEAPLANSDADDSADRDSLSDRKLYPDSCRNLQTAVQQFLSNVSPDDLRNIDERIQTALAGQFGTLVHVCLAAGNFIGKVEELMQSEAEKALEEKLGGVDVAELFVEQYASEGAAGEQLSLSFEGARPVVRDRRSGAGGSFAVLGVPRSAAGDRVRQICVQELGKNSVVTVAAEDVSIYREQSFLKLDELEQFGHLAQEAYRQMQAMEHFTPHTRSDIPEWTAAPTAAGAQVAEPLTSCAAP